MKDRLLSLLKFLIGWPLSFVALFFIVKTVLPEWNTVHQNLESINWLLLFFALLSFLAYYFLRCLIWQHIMKAFSYDLPFRETAFLWAASEVNRYIPGNIWSLLGRTMLFAKKDVAKKDVASALLIEAQFVLLGAVFISLLSLDYLLVLFLPDAPFLPLLRFLIHFFSVSLAAIYIFQTEIVAMIGKKPKGYLEHLLPGLGSGVQFRLLLTSLTAFFFFGLGYYFAISAVIFLDPALLFSLIGLFVFSLLVGYLSFITPTGLGVREGVIMIGLSKLTVFSLAGFASIFARIVLILTEVLFIAITFLWYRTKSTFLNKLERLIDAKGYESVLIVLFLIFSLYFTAVSVLRHDSFYTGRFDLGNMTQTVWNTSQGRFFELTDPDGTRTVSRLAFHADFILVAFAPLYLIWEDPRLLLVIQAIIVGIGGIFVYLIAQHVLKNKPLSLLFAFLYFLNPSLERATIYDFHAVVLATTFLLGAFYYLLKKRFLLFIVFAVLAALTKEQVWFIVALLGAYAAIRYKQVILGGLLFFASLGIFYFLLWHAIPNAHGSGQHFALAYYDDAGDSPSALIKNIVLSPEKTWEKLTDSARINYLKQLLFPLGYLPLASPLYLIFAAPDLTINLFSDRPHLHQIYYQYTAVITPFLFIAAIFGLRNIRQRFPHIPLHFYLLCLFSAGMYAQYLYGPLPGSKSPNLAMFSRQLPNRALVTQYLQAIPEEATVAATNNLGAHLSHRVSLYTIPIGTYEAEYVAFLLTDAGAQPSPEAQRAMVEDLKTDRRYTLIVEDGDFVLFRKRALAMIEDASLW